MYSLSKTVYTTHRGRANMIKFQVELKPFTLYCAVIERFGVYATGIEMCFQNVIFSPVGLQSRPQCSSAMSFSVSLCLYVFAVAERLYCVTAGHLFVRPSFVMHLSAASNQLCGL